MPSPFSRTELLFGEEAMQVLAHSHVAVFGIGGVGGYVCEALCRSGIGSFDLIDSDRVSITNLNRQIIATRKTLGRRKVEVMKERILDINPQAEVNIHSCFFLPENADAFSFDNYNYVVDAVDTVTAKLALITKCAQTDTPIISCMGAGNKLDPTAFKVGDIFDTRMDPLARVMRRELKKRGIRKCKVVYSEEPPIQPSSNLQPGDENFSAGKVHTNAPGSTSFVPSVAGLILAGEVIKDLTADTRRSIRP